MAVTRGTLQIARQLRKDIGAEADSAARTLTGEWADAWDQLAPMWRAAADELVTAAARRGRWPAPAQIMRTDHADRAMSASIDALGKLAERTEAVADAAADRVVQLDTEYEARIVASQAPEVEAPALAQRVAQQAGNVEALREAWALTEHARDDVQLIVSSRIRTDAVNVMARRAREQIHAATVPLSDAAVDSMRRELVRGVDVGDNPRTAAARMVANVEGQFNGGLTRALTIARTETLDAYRATSATIHQANADVVPGWQWQAELGVRTCPSCWAMHGQQFPTSDPGPDDHPTGRCTRLPVLATWAELGITAPEPPSVMGDAQARFAALPQATQLQIMGPGRLELWRSGRIGWDDLSTVRNTPGWRQSRIPTPVRQLRQRAARRGPPARTDPAEWQRRMQAAATGRQARQQAPVSLQRPRVDPVAYARMRTQISDLHQYKGQAYVNVNSALRRVAAGTAAVAGAVATVMPQIGSIDQIMQQSPLASDVVTYRGVGDGPAVFGQQAWQVNMTGAELVDHAYMSTTTSRDIATTFAGDDGVVMRILAPRGTGAVELSGDQYEAELLLQRGLRMRVVADTGPGTTPRRVDLEVL